MKIYNEIDELKASIKGNPNSRVRKIIYDLFEFGTFIEDGVFLKSENSDHSDGVVTGHGFVEGMPILVIAFDGSVNKGQLTELNVTKVLRTQQFAVKTETPILYIVDQNASTSSLDTMSTAMFSSIYYNQIINKPNIAQICLLIEGTSKLSSFIANLSDLVFVSGTSLNSNLNADKNENERPVIADFYDDNIEDSVKKIKQLVSFFPHNNIKSSELHFFDEANNRINVSLDNIESNLDVNVIISEIADNKYTCEVGANFGREVFTCFLRLNGKTIGVVGCSNAEEGGLTSEGYLKIGRFVALCSRFGFPVLTVIDTNGDVKNSSNLNIFIGGFTKLVTAYAKCKTPKVTLVVGEAIGHQFVSLVAKPLGHDFVFAYPNALINSVSLDTYLEHALQDFEGTKDELDKETKRLEEQYKYESSALYNAEIGIIDNIVLPNFTRIKLIEAFFIRSNKADKLLQIF